MKRKVISIAVLSVVCMNAQAEVKPFVGIGYGTYERPPCMLWHQDCAGYYTAWNMHSTTYRLGVDVNGLRVSLFNLQNYSIEADANDNETCVKSGGGKSCPGDVKHYKTTGGFRGLALTYKLDIGHVFMEFGPGVFRQGFKLEKNDGTYYNDHVYGYGFVLGLGLNLTKNNSIGIYTYDTNIGAKFADGAFPAGVGRNTVIEFSHLF